MVKRGRPTKAEKAQRDAQRAAAVSTEQLVSRFGPAGFYAILRNFTMLQIYRRLLTC